jgi:hypothetical protein
VNGFTDKDIGQDILVSQKYLTTFYAQASMEAADPRLRNLLGQLHSESAGEARQIFEYLNSRGWYEVRPASVQEINNLQGSVNHIRQEVATTHVPYGHGAGTAAAGFAAGGYGAGTAGVGTVGYTGGGAGAQQQYGGISGMMTGSNLPQWARQEPQSVQGAGGYYGQPAGGFQTPVYGQTGYAGYGGYGTTLPAWTRQEVPGESGQRASGGPVGYTSQPGGPTYYHGGGPGTPGGFQTGQFGGGYGGYTGYAGYGGHVQLPQWTRQEPITGQRGFQTGMYGGQAYGPQQVGGGYAGYGGYGAYGTTGYTGQLPAWTRQEPRAEFGQQPSGGPVAYTAQPGGPSVYQQHLPPGTPVPSIYRGFDPNIQGGAAMGGQQYGYGGYGTTAYTGQLPAWTRQEPRGEFGQQSSGGPVAYTGQPGGPSVYQHTQAPGTPVQSIYRGQETATAGGYGTGTQAFYGQQQVGYGGQAGTYGQSGTLPGWAYNEPRTDSGSFGRR